MQENVEKDMANRHAYLIMAHGNLAGLDKLLSVLDDAHNDLYIHIDLKCKDFNSDRFIQHIHNARIWFVDRVKVNGVFANQGGTNLTEGSNKRVPSILPSDVWRRFSAKDTVGDSPILLCK